MITCSSWESTWTTPVNVAAIAWAGLTVRTSRLRALRAIAGSMTVQLPRSLRIGAAEEARRSISSSVSGSPCSAICQLNAKSVSGPNIESWRGCSRGRLEPGALVRSRTVLAVRSRPRLRGHSTSTPIAFRSPTPSWSRLTSSSVSRVSWSGTRSSRRRSSTGQASAAARRARVAWVRARSPNPWSTLVSTQRRDASQRWRGFCSSWTWRTRRTAPATNSSSSASTRSEIATRWGRSSGTRERCRSMRAWSRLAKSVAGAPARARDPGDRVGRRSSPRRWAA